MNYNRIAKFENYFFLIVVLLNALPVVITKFFPTLDGAAHLYNSNLLHSLIFKGNENLNGFYDLHQQLIPNWTGHFMLSTLLSFVPAYIAEKLLLLFYIIALPLCFRLFVKRISSDNYFMSYLIFPFTHSFVFFLGFYNFCLALVFLFINLNYWLNHFQKGFTVRSFTLLSLLMLALYFSHIFVFLCFLIFAGLYLLTYFISKYHTGEGFKPTLTRFIKQSSLLCSSALIPLSLFLYYYVIKPSYTGSNIFIDSKELIEWLKNIRPIISFSFDDEKVYTVKILYVLLAATVISIYIRVSAVNLNGLNPYILLRRFVQAIKLSDVWLLAALLMLVFYFVLPDSDGFAGFFSVRLALLFFLFWVVWICLQQFRLWFTILATIVVLYCNFRLNLYYGSVTKKLNEIAVKCNNASDFIVPNSIVLPLNYSDNWLTIHFSNYLGIDKPMVILENYEAGSGLFPIKWKMSSIPQLSIANTNLNTYTCLSPLNTNPNDKRVIDHVFILGDINAKTDSCNIQLKQNITSNYQVIYQNDVCTLYKIK
jgi:hypothetical protein